MNENYYYCDVTLATRYTDFDFCDGLRLSSYLSLIQEAGSLSANEMGIGSDFLWPRGWGFIVTNTYLKIFRPVRTGERLTVRTWPLPPRKVIFERDCEIYGESGEKVAACVSRWCLFDLKNQKILSDAALPDRDYSRYSSRQAFEFCDWKIPAFSLDGATPDYALRVHHADCDRYKHVNNAKYADYCLNCFSGEELEKRRVTGFHITYEKQCKEGEYLSFYRRETAKNEWSVMGVKEDKSIFMRARITLEERSSEE